MKKEIKDLPTNLDLVIVATNAKIRKGIVDELLNHSKVKYLILEKILFTKINDYEYVSKLLKKHKVKTWVNCPLRVFPIYKEVKKVFNGKKIVLSGSFGQNGLMTSIVHFCDLILFLTEENDLSFDLSGIEKKFYNSKRKGYKELYGTIKINVKNRLDAYFSFFDGNISGFITITDGKKRIGLDTLKGIIYDYSNGEFKTKNKLGIPFQSSLTLDYANDLFKNKKLGLPDFKTAAETHLKLFNALKPFMKKELKYSKNDFPFT